MALKQHAVDRRGAVDRKHGDSNTRAELVGLPSYFRSDQEDRLIYEKMRLGIVSALSVNRQLSFSELRDLLGASDGNLSVHARKLEQAGYVICKKSFQGRVPKSEYQLAAKGRRAFERYLTHMEALIDMNRRGPTQS